MKTLDRESIGKLARWLENIKVGKGFANVMFLEKRGLIATKQVPLKRSATGKETRTVFNLTEKGKQMLESANAMLMS